MGSLNTMDVKEYKKSILSLFPREHFWEKCKLHENRIIDVFCSNLKDLIDRLDALTSEIDPRNAKKEGLLPLWKRLFKLEGTASDDEARAEIYFKLTASGGQSKEFYTKFLESLGYAVEIIEFFDRWDKKDEKGNYPWRYRWKIKFKNIKEMYFCAGDEVGGPLAYFPDHKIIELLNKMKQAHTELLFEGESRNV